MSASPVRSILALALALALALVGCSDDPEPSEATSSSSSTTEVGDEPGDEPANEDQTVADDAEWVDFESEEGGFRVELPADPERSEQTLDSEIGPLRAVFFSVTLDAESGVNIAYTDYPEGVRQIDPAVLLDEVVQGSSANVSGTVESSEQLDVAGNPAVDYVISVDGGSFQTRSILVGQRLYGIQRGGTAPDETTFRRLVDSFELVPG